MLKLIFGLICFFSSSQSFATFLLNDFSVSNVKNISLYQYLNGIKNRLKKQAEPVKEPASLQILSKIILVKMINQAQEDFLCILDGFNKKRLFYNLEIEIRFFGICSQFKAVPENTPRLLRKIRAEIKDFDEYLKDYVEKRSNFLEPAERNFIVILQRFNFLLSDIFLNDEFLELNFGDKFLDSVFYRPWEVICNNGKIVAVVLALAAAGIGYILWPEFKKLLEGKTDTASATKNIVIQNVLNTNKADIKIEQLKALHQRGATCGFHAFKNVLYLMLLDNKEDIEKKTVSNDKWKEWLKEMQRVTKDKIWVHGDQLQTLCNPGLVVQWKEYFGVDLNKEQAQNILARIVVVDDIYRFENLQGISEKLSDCVYDFRAGSAQGILIRSSGHWYAAKIQKNVEPDSDAVNVFVINSLSYNLTADSTLNRVINFFVNQEIPTSQMLEVGRILDDCNNILTVPDVLEEGDSESDRVSRILDKFYEVEDTVKQNNFCAQTVFKNIYGPKIKEIWNKIKNLDATCDVKSFFEKNLIQLFD